MNRSIGGFIALFLFLVTSTTAIAGDNTQRNASSKGSGVTPGAACCVVGADCCGTSCPTAACR